MIKNMRIISDNYNVYILSLREIRRFLKVYNQTIISPSINALIFLSIFSLAFGANKPKIEGVEFINFAGYGLIIMSIIQNSFSNSSSSIMMSKILGYIIDILLAPFTGKQIVISYIIGSIARSLCVGFAVTLVLSPFIKLSLNNPLLLLFVVLNSSIFMSLLGIIAGLATKHFDQNATITNYIITPLSFLSGTFYSIKALPLAFQRLNMINPFFYIIDSFRFCFTGNSDSNILFGMIFIFIANIALFIISSKLFDIGWRIKS